MIVTEIFIYPIKSCQGISLKQSTVTTKGFAWDREFMIVDGHNRFISQRQYPQLATIRVELSNQTIQDPDLKSQESITLSQVESKISPLTWQPKLTGKEISVQVWSDRTVAIDQGDEVAQWFEQALNLKPEQSCRLVRQSPQHPRQVEKNMQ